MHPQPSESQYASTARRSAEDKNASFTAQSLLIGRQKELTDMQWVEKYADAFRDLFGSDDDFVAAVRMAADKRSSPEAVEKALVELRTKLEDRLSKSAK